MFRMIRSVVAGLWGTGTDTVPEPGGQQGRSFRPSTSKNFSQQSSEQNELHDCVQYLLFSTDLVSNKKRSNL